MRVGAKPSIIQCAKICVVHAAIQSVLPGLDRAKKDSKPATVLGDRYGVAVVAEKQPVRHIVGFPLRQPFRLHFKRPFRYHRLQHLDHVASSEENTSELQSLMRISYAVFCLKKKTIN